MVDLYPDVVYMLHMLLLVSHVGCMCCTGSWWSHTMVLWGLWCNLFDAIIARLDIILDDYRRVDVILDQEKRVEKQKLKVF